MRWKYHLHSRKGINEHERTNKKSEFCSFVRSFVELKENSNVRSFFRKIATSDSWTDKHRRLTYICLVAHCNVIGENGFERHRFNLYCNEITELVKTKQVIVTYILNVLSDYVCENMQKNELGYLGYLAIICLCSMTLDTIYIYLEFMFMLFKLS